MLTSLFALTAGLAATASAFDCSGPYFSFYNRNGPALSYQRLDPALFPGQESPHLHSFDGGSGLAAEMSFDSTQSSTCTTARIKPDKSLYWRPTLFWNGNNTGYYRVPDQFLKIYYKFGDSGNVKANVSEFPENFSMIAGDPFKRSDGDNPAGIRWACHGPDSGDDIYTNGFPKGFTQCKNGLASEVTFPSCWNGKDLDPKSPAAHMTWPTNNGKGLDACPDGFKAARFPTIFIEFWYDISAFDGQYSADDVPWVLANGDPTGFGFHADFRNGWEKGVLAKATADEGYCNCGCGCGNDEMKQCFGDANVNDDSDANFKSCSATAEFPGDDSSPLDKLPGCNPIQSGPAEATQATGPDCTAAAAPATGGDESSAAVSGGASATPAPESSGAASSEAASSAAASNTGASKAASVADAEETSALPSLTMSIPNKELGNGVQSEGGYDIATTLSKTAAGQSEPTSVPTMSLVSSAASPTGPAPTSGSGEGECAVPTTVTITPTIYVTAGAVANATSCDPGTIYKTVTNTATVTVSAGSSYVRHKRHGDLHHKH
ncbi:hypothetical protein BU26DRAFT_558661 [Trematosphaeria pertusa]|uniref:DUF1996 domain-containing protein n=1 Tax=Trematosphaeria pertusa TaxID=390896 RepID=A0A6A6J4G9_9PLEO|nr:uncharacterized protein BU26DRAFT_558661 [Trematosphaeria pertusa]KAF2257267.1 hypothetical protein BU26DRAFT_558661 [Trematosphaeria pertusa]